MKTSINQNPTPQEHWEDLKKRILAEIKEIDDATPGGAREPAWWLEMMDFARSVRSRLAGVWKDGKVTIELSERLMDHWYCGDKQMPKYHAQIAGEGGYWGCGRNPEEAIESVLRSHPERFPDGRNSVVVEYVGRNGR